MGALGFAHALNRTLVLPPWVEYRYGETKSIQIPFIKYFKVDPLQSFTKVITMEEFMQTIAPIEWPPADRTVFCYAARGKHSKIFKTYCESSESRVKYKYCSIYRRF